MKASYYFLGLWLQVLCIPAFSQQPYIAFRYVTAPESRLSQSSVNCMLKDSYGLMWFGTQDGLNKYDGYSFTVYKKRLGDPKSIISNDIYSILEDKDGNIWLAAIGAGISRYDRKTDSFENFGEIRNDPRSLSSKHAYTIYEDRRGNIWVGTSAGLNLFDKKTKKFTRYLAVAGDSLYLSSNDILYIFEDKKNNFWVGTRHGLNLMNRESGKCRQYLHDPSDIRSIGNNAVQKIMEDSYGNLWIGTNTSMELFNSKSGIFTHFKSSYAQSQGKGKEWPVYAITQDGNFLWVGADNLSRFDISRKCYVNYTANADDNQDIPGKEVYSMLLDDQNILWVGTSSDGIYKYEKDLPRFAGYYKDHINDHSNMVTSFAEDHKGNIWTGSFGGLGYFDRSTKKFSTGAPGISNSIPLATINIVFNTRENKIWLGSPGRLDVFDPSTGTADHFTEGKEPAHFNGRTTSCLFEDTNGDIWIGTSNGAERWDKKKKEFTHYQPDLDHNLPSDDRTVCAIAEDAAGRIWMGTWYNGIFVLDRTNNKFTHYNTANSNLNGDLVNVFLKDSRNNFWIGTMDGGFCRYNPQTNDFTPFSEEQGLINNVINSILEDEKGYLWMSTNKGVARFDPVQKRFMNYTIYNGLQNDEFNVGAGLKTRNGEIFFGGLRGFNVFSPAAMPENKYIPPVIFTGFELFNKPVIPGSENPVLKQPISVTKEITLSYTQSVFTFEFAALNYVYSGKNQYAYKMEGFDKEWNYVGTKKSATYTNLDPGNYVFRVKASNNDGLWNEEGISIRVIIRPPFWKTWWFKASVIIILAGSIVIFFRLRLNAARKQQVLLEQKVKEQTVELVHSHEVERQARMEANQANEELGNKNTELEQFVYIVSHDLREPLRTTSSFVELLSEEHKGKLGQKGDKYLSFIIQASERMKIMVNDLLEYSRLGGNKEPKEVDCNIVLQEVTADLGAAIREAGATITADPLPVITGLPTGIKQVFQNLIANGIKFRKKDMNPEIRISAEAIKGAWKFSFADNGIGIEKQHSDRIFVIFQRLHTRTEYEGSGIGLSHCKKIIELHKGKIWIESIPGKGTTFYFTIPKA